MPVLVKDYQWSETTEMVYIEVHLKGVKASKVDIFCTKEFLKASFPPFLFEVLLFDEIDDDKSAAKVTDGCIVFSLKKIVPKLWNQLLSDKADDKKFVLEKKKEAIENAQKRTEERMKHKAEIKAKDKKYALNEMMKLEEQSRSRIENIKEDERIRTEKETEEWKRIKIEQELKEKMKLEREKFKDYHKNNEYKADDKENIFEEERPKIIELSDDDENTESNQGNTTEPREIFANGEHKDQTLINNQKQEKRSVGPRQSGTIDFKFTPRVFPTPVRESKAAEEDEWLQKQAAARKICEIDDPDLKEHEKDPVWLKDKGTQLFKSGNLQAAVNAFNLAIRLQPKQPILFLNRAACHLKLRNLYKCIEDSSNALELLTPPVSANAKGRIKGHLRRGTAFCELELYAEGLQDYMAASKIDPKNEQIRKDAEKIREIIEKGT